MSAGTRLEPLCAASAFASAAAKVRRSSEISEALLALGASDRASLSPHAATIKEQAALSDNEACWWAKRTVLNKLAEYERLNPAEA